MSEGPYNNKPRIRSEPNEWHELSFQISIDQPCDWDNVDLRKWSHMVAKYTALMMAVSTDEVDEDAGETIKTLVQGVKVDRIKLVSDESLHEMIDEFDLE